MKHSLLVLVSLGLAATGNVPAWARGSVHGLGPGGSVRGFPRRAAVGVPVWDPRQRWAEPFCRRVRSTSTWSWMTRCHVEAARHKTLTSIL